MGTRLRLLLFFEEGAPRHDTQVLIPRTGGGGGGGGGGGSSGGSGSGSSSGSGSNSDTDGPYRMADVLGDGRIFLCIKVSPLNKDEAEKQGKEA